jgi:SAM-dependent methyltransferase
VAGIDSLTSPTLKHLREEWWDDEFTEFLAETLRPRPGNRILDVGCGEGLAEVSIGRLHISQIRQFGVDLVVEKVIAARQETASHNQRAAFAAGDAVRLPFIDGAFDSIYCVAVLQHVRDLNGAVRELARVARPGGRVVAVEPDNRARYGYSSTPAGARAFELAGQFFAALTARDDLTDNAPGPQLPALFSRHGIEPSDVRLFPVSLAWLGPPGDEVWIERRASAESLMRHTSDGVRSLGGAYLEALEEYEAEARRSPSSFVEIQNTMLFATVGQRSE